MDRMSPLDATFLHVEDGINHMHIASCAVFEGPAPAYDDLVDLFRGKLPLVPRYRQKVRFVPGGVGRPVWVDDPHFRLDYHIRHTALPPPGNRQDLRNLMGRLMSHELDRHRPLWETWMVEGLDDGTWALISKVHHCMVDGISGTDLMALVLDASPDGTPPVPDTWHPNAEPSDAVLVRDALVDTLVRPDEMARLTRAVFRRPRRLLDEANQVLTSVRALGEGLKPNVELPIEGTIGPHRRWVTAATTIADVKRIRAAHGGTVNDVVLAAITSGYRDLLLGRGEQLDGVVVRSLVPVSVRAKGDHTLNNQVASIIAELPVGIADPLDRLHAVRSHMQHLKQSGQAEASRMLFDAADQAPPVLLSAALRAAVTVMRRLPQRSVNTVTTNVPGPQVPLYACGRRMTEYAPFVPLAQGLRTGVAILSYDGNVSFGITGDWDAMPDLDVLADGIERAIAELLELSRPSDADATVTTIPAAPRTKSKKRQAG